MVQDKHIGYSLGASDFLPKPIEQNLLQKLLAKYSPMKSDEPLSALVIEDDHSIRQLLKLSLENEGWQVAEAEDGFEALAKVEETIPSLILLDLLLPKMDGFKFLSELRKNPHYRFIPVIVVTAMKLTPEHYEKLQGSVTNILHKAAYEQDALLETVVEQVRSHIESKKKV